ncbi:hypothetical protein [Novosphingobium olei]|uniref:hypothetical protein n=1 Tax=Novosphingobium olei TaxID=2728851 RepID=UPI00308C5E14|nr:hypothetical protein NSDW_12250 [Novosphingobium olei]
MTFPYHRSVAPMVWALFGLAVLEMLAVHLLVSLKWPALAWPLTILTFLSLVWLVGWIRSFARLPHRLDGDVLVLHMGSLRRIELRLDQIAGILRDWPAGTLGAPDVRKLVPVAYPNRIIEVAEGALAGKRRRFAIRLDDPSPFDAAMTQHGIAVSG